MCKIRVKDVYKTCKRHRGFQPDEESFCIQCSLHCGNCENFKPNKLDVTPSFASDIIVPELGIEERDVKTDLSEFSH